MSVCVCHMRVRRVCDVVRVFNVLCIKKLMCSYSTVTHQTILVADMQLGIASLIKQVVRVGVVASRVF